MKKLFSLTLTILVILPAFFSFATQVKAGQPQIDGVIVVRNSDNTVSIPQIGLNRKDGAIVGTLSGTLTTGTSGGYEDLQKKKSGALRSNLVLRYERITSTNNTPPLIANSFLRDSFFKRFCSIKEDKTFTCPLDGLQYGSYAFVLGAYAGSDEVDGWTPYMPIAAFNVVNTTSLSGENVESFNPQVMEGKSVKITGKVDAQTIELAKTKSRGDFYVVWGPQKNLPTDKEKIADLSNKVKLDYNKDTGAFSGMIPDLSRGVYVFVIEDFKGLSSGKNESFVSSFIEVPVSGQSSQNQYKLTDPVSTGGNGLDIVTGNWADPIVTIDKPDAGFYKLELGYATPVSPGDVHYTCAFNGDNEEKMLGPAVSVAAGLDSVPIKNSGKFIKLQPSLYCVGLRYSLIGESLNSSGIPTDLSKKTFHPLDVALNSKFFVVTSAGKPGIFSVGGAAIPPGATLDPLANGNGCSTGTDNSTYCLLAPLPGVGDATGKLDVATGMGDYINAIIKLLMGLIGVLSVLMIVIGGIEYMSTVSLGEKEGARERITNALFGLLLTLSAYLILYTINPNLVNLTVTVPHENIQVDGEEGLEEDTSNLVLASDSVTPTGIAVPKGSAPELARKILQNTNITLAPMWGSQDARSTVSQNLKDTAAGTSTWTSPPTSANSLRKQAQTTLDPRMLAGILAAADAAGRTISITEIAGGGHSGPTVAKPNTPLSGHYRGLAFDIGGSGFSNDVGITKKIEDACKAAGANPRQIFGPCNGAGSGSTAFIECKATGYRTNSVHENHVHCGW